MKTILIIVAFFMAWFTAGAQMTYVPDDNFEQALIDLGYDTPPLNDSVPTENIKNVITLKISKKNISDLTGIEDFTSLASLDCSQNQLESLDISNNTYLRLFWCYDNFLTNLDLSQNLALIKLWCDSNQLTSLNLNGNSALQWLHCPNNKITELDLSKNVDLTALYCHNNNLSYLNVKNGNNQLMQDCGLNWCFRSTNNPNLKCILVDDSIWSSKRFPYWEKDDHAIYSEDCSLVSVEEVTNPVNDFTLSPNPANNYIEINIPPLERGSGCVSVFDVLGIKRIDELRWSVDTRLRGNDILVSSEGNVRIDISSLSPGVYFVRVGSKVSKFVKI